MCSEDRRSAARTDFSNPEDAAALVRQARALAGAGPAAAQLMLGKKLALLSPLPGDDDAGEFLQAATALGAHVSVVQPGLDEQSSPGQVDAMARVLSQLYDVVECQHLPATLVQRIARSAVIPVFEGLATPGHPTAALVNALNDDRPRPDGRRRILQAALLISLG